MARPIVYLDDSTSDLRLMQVFHGQSSCVNHLLTFSEPEQLFDYMRACREGREKLPHVLVVDVRMPDIDGFDVVARLREDHVDDLPPVVYFTGAGTSDAVESSARHDGVLVTKPSELEEYRELVDNLFGV